MHDSSPDTFLTICDFPLDTQKTQQLYLAECQTTICAIKLHGQIWVNQKDITIISGLNLRTVSDHISRLKKRAGFSASIRKLRIVQGEAGRTVSRDVMYYNDALVKELSHHVRKFACPSFFSIVRQALEENEDGLPWGLQMKNISAAPVIGRADHSILPKWEDIVSCLKEHNVGRTRRFEKGQTVYRQRDISQTIYILTKGKLKICYISADGKEFIQRIFDMGSIIGIVPLLLNSKHESSCLAMVSSEICELTMDDFQWLIKEKPEITIDIMRQLSYSVRYYAWTSRILSNPNTKARMMECLQRIAYEYGNTMKDGSISLRIQLTQQSIAEMIGASRQNVSTFLNQLKQEGVIEESHKNLIIRHPWF